MLAGMEASIRWPELIRLTFVNVWLRRLRVITAINWVRRLRETGSIRPGKIGGYKPKSIRNEHRVWLLARIKNRDFTLRGLVAELAARGLKVDYRTVWSFVHDEKLSFKKKRGGWRTRASGRGATAGAVD